MPFQHFDAGIVEMLARVLRPDVIQERFNLRAGNIAKETAVRVLMRRALLFIHNYASFSSTVSILFCNDARVG